MCFIWVELVGYMYSYLIIKSLIYDFKQVLIWYLPLVLIFIYSWSKLFPNFSVLISIVFNIIVVTDCWSFIVKIVQTTVIEFYFDINQLIDNLHQSNFTILTYFWDFDDFALFFIFLIYIYHVIFSISNFVFIINFFSLFFILYHFTSIKISYHIDPIYFLIF